MQGWYLPRKTSSWDIKTVGCWSKEFAFERSIFDLGKTQARLEQSIIDIPSKVQLTNTCKTRAMYDGLDRLYSGLPFKHITDGQYKEFEVLDGFGT